MTALATEVLPRAVAYDPDSRAYEAFNLGTTKLLGRLSATNIKEAMAEATERWAWDRGDRLGIRELGQEDAPIWPFDKQPLDRLYVYAVRRSAPIGWKPSADLMRSIPIYKYNLDLICSIDINAIHRDGSGEHHKPLPSDQ